MAAASVAPMKTFVFWVPVVETKLVPCKTRVTKPGATPVTSSGTVFGATEVTVAGAALTDMLTGITTAVWPAGVIVIEPVRTSPGTACCVVAEAEAVKERVVPQL